MSNQNYRQIHIAVFLLFLIAAISCSEKTSQIEDILRQSEFVMEAHPDSALTLLNSIENPKALSEPIYHEYILLMIQAKDKNYMDIDTDTLIRDAADYFMEADDARKASKAYFYNGRISLYQKDYKPAINEFLKAEDLAIKNNDYFLLGMVHSDIGRIYSAQLDDERALNYYYSAKDYFHKAGDAKRESYMLRRIANRYLTIEPQMVDEAILLYEQALNHAIMESDSVEISGGLNDLAVAYSKKKDFENAKKYIFESVALINEHEPNIRGYNILSNIYLGMNQPDSAIFYLNSLSGHIDNMDNFTLYSHYSKLYRVYAYKGDYKTALEYNEKMLELYGDIVEENNNASILEIEEKYNNERLRNEYNLAVIEKQKTRSMLYIIAIVALIAGILAFILHKKNEQKRMSIEIAKEAIDGLTSDSNKSNERLRKKIVEELNLTKKVAYIHSLDTKHSKAFIKEYESLLDVKIANMLDWQHIYLLIDDLYPNFRVRLDKEIPSFSEKEKQHCYLIRANFRTSEIAYILGYGRESADSMKYKLRTKAGFGSMSEFEAFLDALS